MGKNSLISMSSMLALERSSSSSCTHFPPLTLISSSFTTSSRPTSQSTLPINHLCAPIPRNEDCGPLAKTPHLTSYEPNVTDTSVDFEVVPSFFQGSSVETGHDLVDNDAKSPDAEIEDEHIRSALALPRYTQESEAQAASLRQTYHSN